ncbi:MAG: NnrS family protein [Nitrospirales bacterium]|nr:NnrS family protein [Nitrospirales bacterium]
MRKILRVEMRHHSPKGKASSQELAFFSYGFRPFFLSAALFVGVAIPIWVFIFAGSGNMAFLYAPRDWHAHEMTFGFLPCVIAGFLLTAMPNWTDRPPIRGWPLMLLVTLWLAGRLAIVLPWFSPLASAIVDAAFLVVMAGVVWREIVASKAWDRLPMGMLMSLYASANILFHVLWLSDAATNFAERMALALVMVLLALIGGRVTSGFTEDFLVQQGMAKRPVPFSPFDGIALVSIGIAAIAWMLDPQAIMTGWMLIVGGVINLVRLIRWHGWLTWREPLVLVLHVGYGWLVMALLAIGGASLGGGLPMEDALHALTTGAVGVMTLAVMTRASLGHTGRIKHAGPLTVMIYLLVNLGAILRVFGPGIDISSTIVLGVAALCWSGAYMLFVVGYGCILLGRSVEEALPQ